MLAKDIADIQDRAPNEGDAKWFTDRERDIGYGINNNYGVRRDLFEFGITHNAFNGIAQQIFGHDLTQSEANLGREQVPNGYSVRSAFSHSDENFQQIEAYIADVQGSDHAASSAGWTHSIQDIQASNASLNISLVKSYINDAPATRAHFDGIMQKVAGRGLTDNEFNQVKVDLGNNRTSADIQQGFVNTAWNNGLGNQLSRDILGHDITPDLDSYFNGWLKSEMQQGKSYDDVRTELANTPAATAAINAMVKAVFGAEPNANDFNKIHTAIQQGKTLAQERIETVASLKYFAGPNTPVPQVDKAGEFAMSEGRIVYGVKAYPLSYFAQQGQADSAKFTGLGVGRASNFIELMGADVNWAVSAIQTVENIVSDAVNGQIDPNNLHLVNELKQAFYNSSVGSQLKSLLGRFGHGAEWDIQRFGGKFNPALVDGANFNIGVYAAKAGISLPVILGVANIYALDNTYIAGTTYDSIYRFLSKQDVDAITAGYSLAINNGI